MSSFIRQQLTAGGTTGASSRGRLGTLWWDLMHDRWCYLFLVPSLVLAAFFTFYPMVMSWVYSLLDWTGFTTSGTFIGLANYQELVRDPRFWSAFGRSFLFVLVAVPVRLGLSLIVAIILNDSSLKLAPVFRTCFFLPVVTSAAVVGIVMTFILSPFHGPANQALLDIHLLQTPVDFLGNPKTALWTLMAVQVWKDFGISMIYWLAALQTVPKVYYEAARVDGAGPFQVLRSITVPILLPFVAVITLLTANNTLHVFALVQTMTQGGPYFATNVIETYIYQTAFAPTSGGVPRIGYASAAGCFFGVAVMLIALSQGWLARKAAGLRAALVNG